MTRTRQRSALLSGLCALLLSSCGISAEGTPRALDPDTAPFRQVAQPPTPAPTGTGRSVVYLVRDNQLVAVVRRVPAATTPGDLLAALASGPTPREAAAGLSSAAPSEARVDTNLSTSTVTAVEVPAPAGNQAGRSDEVLGYAQIVLTLTAGRVTGVRFTRDGQPLDVPRADGSLTHDPVGRAAYATLL